MPGKNVVFPELDDMSRKIFAFQEKLRYVLHCNLRLGNLVARAFCFRGWMVSEKGPGFGWSVLQPDWSMILNVIIQNMLEKLLFWWNESGVTNL